MGNVPTIIRLTPREVARVLSQGVGRVHPRGVGVGALSGGYTEDQLAALATTALSYTTGENVSSEQEQFGAGCGAGFSGDGISNGGAWSATGTGNGCDLITTAANYSGGRGGRGFRHKYGDGGANNNGGGMTWTWGLSTSKFWLRHVIRYEAGVEWVGGEPTYDKIIRVYAGGLTLYLGFQPSSSGAIGIDVNGGQDSIIGSISWTDIYPGGTADGSWFSTETFIDKANTTCRIWVNGILAGEKTNMDFSGATTWSYCKVGDNHSTPSLGGVIHNVDYDALLLFADSNTPPNVDAAENAMIGPPGWS